jgi:hypothetical protein
LSDGGYALHHQQRTAPAFFGGFMKTRFALWLVAFCAALFPATAKSQSQETQSQETQTQNSQARYSESQADRGACMADAFTVCGQFIPDRERVGDCLVANASRVSPACREAIKRFVPETATR